LDCNDDDGIFGAQIHMFALFYVFGFSLHDDDLFTSFGFKSKPTLIGLLLFMQVIWSPIDKVLGFLMNVWSRRNEVRRITWVEKYA